MDRIIDFSKPVATLIKQYPEIITILKDLGFKMIDKPIALATLGKVTSINKGASIKKIDINLIGKAFEDEGFKVINKGNK